MSKKPPSQNAIGRELGLSPATMTKLSKQGCPMDSVESVRAWRKKHLHPAYTKRTPHHPAPVAAQHVAHAEACMRAAASMLKDGVPLDVFAPTLRSALAAVPLADRPTVGMDAAVMRWLTDPLFAVLPPPNETEGAQPAGEMSDDDAAYVGGILYGLACGELVVNSEGKQ